MVCDDCLVGGYLDLLPTDDPADWQQRFADTLTAGLAANRWSAEDVTIAFPENYLGHQTDSGSPLCPIAESTVRLRPADPDNVAPWSGWAAFNSGCEAGLRANLLGPDAGLGAGQFGPGARRRRVRRPGATSGAVAGQFVRFIGGWCGPGDVGR